LPENPMSDEYKSIVPCLRDLCEYMKNNGQYFLFETGQETPVTLMRVIQDSGRKNLGVNLDPANLILYGRANPIDALDIYGDRIRGVHIKDGNYPKGDYNLLGEECVVGEGAVNYPFFLPKLLESGYKGDLYIEREIEGEEQMCDILKTIRYVKSFLEG